MINPECNDCTHELTFARCVDLCHKCRRPAAEHQSWKPDLAFVCPPNCPTHLATVFAKEPATTLELPDPMAGPRHGSCK